MIAKADARREAMAHRASEFELTDGVVDGNSRICIGADPYAAEPIAVFNSRAGWGEGSLRPGLLGQRVQMLLGISASHGVFPLEFKPADSVGDLLLQHLKALEQEALEQEALEQEALDRGGIQQLLTGLFAKVYKVAIPGVAA
jgi:hypothetical protein